MSHYGYRRSNKTDPHTYCCRRGYRSIFLPMGLQTCGFRWRYGPILFQTRYKGIVTYMNTDVIARGYTLKLHGVPLVSTCYIRGYMLMVTDGV